MKRNVPRILFHLNQPNSRAERRLRMRQARQFYHFDRLINEKYGGERGRSQARFGYKMELRDAVCKRFQSTEILRHAERIVVECSSI